MTQRPARHILVIKLGALGDFIQAIGPMIAIRLNHPHDRITLLTTKPFESIARASALFDEVWIDERPKWVDVKGWYNLRKKLNSGTFSRVYDLQNNDRTGFYFKLFSYKPEWSGVAKGASHRNDSPQRTAGRAFDGHVQTLALAGIHTVEPDRLEWMQGRTDYEGLRQPYMLIVPGSASSHPEKRWPVNYYSNICARLVARGCLPVLIGSEAEKETLESINVAVPEALNLCGQTNLFDIATLARHAGGALGNDTGPMHLIAPTGCKTLVLFSKNTNPARHAPMGDHVVTLQKNNLKDLTIDEVWRTMERQQSVSPS